MIRQHEVINGTCKWCFAVNPDLAEGQNTCIARWPISGNQGLRPEPALRPRAADNADTISARLTELRAERDAALVRGEE